MERKAVVVCAAVGFLGLLSAALGIAAEATRVKASEVQTPAPGKCSYPDSPALALGLGAAVALMIAQAIINTVAGCICCKRNSQPSDTNWSAALISFIVSWITFIIAFLLLLTGAALNDQRGEQNMYFGGYCYVVKPGVFSGGAVLSLASVALGRAKYVLWWLLLCCQARGVFRRSSPLTRQCGSRDSLLCRSLFIQEQQPAALGAATAEPKYCIGPATYPIADCPTGVCA